MQQPPLEVILGIFHPLLDSSILPRALLSSQLLLSFWQSWLSTAWPKPNYVDPITRGHENVILQIVLYSCLMVFLGLRLFTRLCLKRAFGADDILILAAAVRLFKYQTSAVADSLAADPNHRLFRHQRPRWYQVSLDSSCGLYTSSLAQERANVGSMIFLTIMSPLASRWFWQRKFALRQPVQWWSFPCSCSSADCSQTVHSSGVGLRLWQCSLWGLKALSSASPSYSNAGKTEYDLPKSKITNLHLSQTSSGLLESHQDATIQLHQSNCLSPRCRHCQHSYGLHCGVASYSHGLVFAATTSWSSGSHTAFRIRLYWLWRRNCTNVFHVYGHTDMGSDLGIIPCLDDKRNWAVLGCCKSSFCA